MKTFVLTCTGLLLLAGPAMAAEWPVSDSTLGGMGLRGMQRMSDSDGLAIRGRGVHAGVWGGSITTWGSPGTTATSSNFYQAGSRWHGNNSTAASGQSLSFAGQIGAQLPGGNLGSLSANAGLSGGLSNSLTN